MLLPPTNVAAAVMVAGSGMARGAKKNVTGAKAAVECQRGWGNQYRTMNIEHRISNEMHAQVAEFDIRYSCSVFDIRMALAQLYSNPG
jgi:hypothetical protein